MHSVAVSIGDGQSGEFADAVGYGKSEPGGAFLLAAFVEWFKDACGVQRRVNARIADGETVGGEGDDDASAVGVVDKGVLEQVGDFTLQAGQHCVTYETSDELSDGQYYLTMYNNNNATISTRDYDYDSDENYDGTYSGTEGDESYYYKYLVDETAGTFTLVDSVPVTYSGYVSSVQQVGDNLLTDSGSAFEANEFDQDHNLIQTLTGSGATWWYRVFKYDYSGYWFA